MGIRQHFAVKLPVRNLFRVGFQDDGIRRSPYPSEILPQKGHICRTHFRKVILHTVPQLPVRVVKEASIMASATLSPAGHPTARGGRPRGSRAFQPLIPGGASPHGGTIPIQVRREASFFYSYV